MALMDFTRKAVGSLTLGEKLKKIRSDHRISLAEVSRSTRIQVKYLEALEEGAYEKLPPEVYVRGFLRSYAGFLGVPEEAILKLYDRERSIQRNLGRVDQGRFQPKLPVNFSFVFSSRSLFGVAIALVTAGFFGYLYFEFHSFVSEPRLIILEPQDGMNVTDAEISVRGETDPRADVTINGERVSVDERGMFTEVLKLAPGLNTIDISSSNRFGKTRSRSLAVNATLPQENAGETPPLLETPVESVALSVRMVADTTLTVRSDGETVFSGALGEGEEKSFSARETITIAAEKGNVVLVRAGQAPEEPLSESEGAAEATFGKDGRLTVQ